MKKYLNVILVLNLFLSLVANAQENESLTALNTMINSQLRILEGFRDVRQESYNPARIALRAERVKALFQKRKELYGEEPSIAECYRLGIDYCYKISPYLQERNQRLSTREGIEKEILHLRSQLEIYKSDSFRLGIIHGDLAALYIRLAI